MSSNSTSSQGIAGAAARSFFARKRVTISLILFLGLIVEDVIFQTKPQHGWLRDASRQGYIGLPLVLFGVALRSWAAGTLRKGIDLTTVGPYSLCRNPLYLGSFAVMVGFCLLIGYAHDFLVVCGPIMAIYVLTVLDEERRLNAQYPVRWPEYAIRNPRFLPWKLSNFRTGQWSVRQWLKSREYQGLTWTLLGIVALEAWRLHG